VRYSHLILTNEALAQITVVGQDDTPTIKQYLEESFDYRYAFVGQVVAILLGFTAFFAGLAVGASSSSAAPSVRQPLCILLRS